jgi:murein DD-endopeptidase MepM/ murein hydrolase activator NlpD
MKIWPLKDDRKRAVPRSGPGSFWENRADRRHCGVDLYAPCGTVVLALDKGVVTRVGIATSPRKNRYWNTTRYVVVRHGTVFVKYAELGRVDVRKGENVAPGRKIGEVGLVLDKNKIDSHSPLYIRKLGGRNPSMLHLEFFREKPITRHRLYLGGNWFGAKKPEGLLDPTPILSKLKRKKSAPRRKRGKGPVPEVLRSRDSGGR